MRLTFIAILIILSVSMVAQPRDRAEISREIDLLNAMLKLDNATWSADMTSVSLLSDADIQNMLGMIEPEMSRDEFVYDAERWPASGKEVLAPNITKIKNQARCGSCVSFGTTACFEQTYWTKTGKKTIFSERYLFFCSPYKGYGCNGGWSLDGGAVAASNSRKGMIKSDKCPYYSNGSYHYDCGNGCDSKAQKTTMSYNRVSSNGYIRAIDSGHAVIIGMTVYEDFRNYKKGVYEHLQGRRLGGHCMALVGYGTTKKGEHYWVIKNSWSKGWGDNGYIRIRIKSEQKNKDSNVEDYGGYVFK